MCLVHHLVYYPLDVVISSVIKSLEKLKDVTTGDELLKQLNDHLMVVDEEIKRKYLGILAQADEEKGMMLHDSVRSSLDVA